MYGDGVNESVVEDPLWKVFLENPSILDDAEEEEQRLQESRAMAEQDKRSLQEQIERTENSAKYSRDLFFGICSCWDSTFRLRPAVQ